MKWNKGGEFRFQGKPTGLMQKFRELVVSKRGLVESYIDITKLDTE